MPSRYTGPAMSLENMREPTVAVRENCNPGHHEGAL